MQNTLTIENFALVVQAKRIKEKEELTKRKVLSIYRALSLQEELLKVTW